MAHLNQRRPENVSGDFYVDRTCIDCDTCRWMAPEVFRSEGDQSAVYHQPRTESEPIAGNAGTSVLPYGFHWHG
ncbi:ferredoxin [Kovacikia minuta]|uniref:ferredoxin n=1 Tax=Kovacikia minuta TaxID=2931930 RepID=UPI0020C78178